MIRIAPAGEDDRAALDVYLAARGESSMFLRSNLWRGGLGWSGARYEGQYVLAWDGDRVAGIVGHAWNGMMMVQADVEVAALTAALVAHSGRPITGFTGPHDQVHAARRAAGLDGAPTRLDVDEPLMSLALDQLIVPPALAGGDVQVRHATAADRDVVVAWRVDYELTANAAPPGDETDRHAARWFAAAIAEDNLWLAEHGGVSVAMTQFNARVPGWAQVGGVYTPPAQRARGYARAVVAASLLEVRAAGVTRAILFTAAADAAAAYSAVGFTTIGRFGIVLLA